MNTPKTMTVGQLRALLQGCDDSTPIGYACPAGDYWRSTVLGEITKATKAVACHSRYHGTFVVVKEHEGGDVAEDESVVLVLS